MSEMAHNNGELQRAPQRYEPVEAVVGPAFSELLMRVGRARATAAGNAALGGEERILFDYGVSQRRRVLEHTLFLVFAQWAVYRQFVSRLSSRFVRTTYGLVAFGSTAAFARYRAALVTQELFAHLITRDTDSALSNEARIILAELEGPHGPYFRSVCEERGFASQYEEAIATKEVEASGSLDHNQGALHPQLRLNPRLLTPEVVAAAQHPNIRPNRPRPPRFPNNVDSPSARQRREKGLADLVHDRDDGKSDDTLGIINRESQTNTSNVWAQIRSGGKSNLGSSENSPDDLDQRGTNNDGNGSGNWAITPFDFAKAAHHEPSSNDLRFRDSDRGNNDDRNDFVHGGSDGENSDDFSADNLTPAQRRAEERRRRRHQAKMRTSPNWSDST